MGALVVVALCGLLLVSDPLSLMALLTVAYLLRPETGRRFARIRGLAETEDELRRGDRRD